jgi:prolipoprotein diacylglyceryltransferase
MGPSVLTVYGLEMSVWNVTFLVGVAIGYVVLEVACRLRLEGSRPAYLPFRWIMSVYISTLGAQLFAYLFDLHTSALPPPSISWMRYYLDPLFGPKTLYGAIVFMPLSVVAIFWPWKDLDFRAGLDCCTPPLFAVIGVARIGCFLYGCCYGMRWDRWGISFPPDAPVSDHHLEAGLIDFGMRSLPVVPTQLISMLALLCICVWTLWRLRENRKEIFPDAVALYSIFRFGIECVRDDPDRNFLGPFSSSQWISLSLLAIYITWRFTWANRSARPDK